MKKIQTYQCEICSTIHGTEAAALACEALGLPAPLTWMPLGEPIPAFGERDIRWATITGNYPVLAWGRHVWAVTLDRHVHLSHNQSYDGPAFAEWFDPRVGYDPFRCGYTAEELRIWEQTMARYGFAESEASEWVRDHVAKARNGAQIKV